MVSEELPAEEDCPTRAEGAVLVSQVTAKDETAGIFGITEDAVTALIFLEGHNGEKMVENLLQAMLQGPVNRTLDEILKSM